MGRFEEGIKQERAAVTLDPLAPNPRYMMGMMLGCLHRYDEAIEVEKAVVAQSPNFAYAAFTSPIFTSTRPVTRRLRKKRAPPPRR